MHELTISAPCDNRNVCVPYDSLSDVYGDALQYMLIERPNLMFDQLSESDQEWLTCVRSRLAIERIPTQIGVCIGINKSIINELWRLWKEGSISKLCDGWKYRVVIQADVDLCKTILLWIARDWSGEDTERRQVYAPVLDAVARYCPSNNDPSCEKLILLPGLGLARLMVDLATLGYRCVGLEREFLFVLALQHIINLGMKSETTVIAPYLTETCNRVSSTDNTRQLRVPDIPIDVSALSRMTVDCNDFWTWYNSRDIGDAQHYSHVVTCFSLDTIGGDLNSIVCAINSVLVKNGVWINCGRLAFVNEPGTCKPSVYGPEIFSLDKLMEAVAASGFIVKEQTEINTTFLNNGLSLMCNQWVCPFFVAQKV